MIEKVYIALFCLLSASITHVLIFHFMKINEKAKTIEIIFLIFFVIFIILMFALPDNFLFKNIQYSKSLKMFSVINAIILYILIFHFYIGTYFLIDRSISCRITIELSQKPQIGMTQEELYQYYNGDMIMERRLDHLIYGKFVKIEDGKYINTKSGSILAETFKLLKNFLNLNKGG